MVNTLVINNINLNIVQYNDKSYVLISSFLGYQNNPANGLFILINDKLFTDDNDIQIFLHSLQNTDIMELS